MKVLALSLAVPLFLHAPALQQRPPRFEDFPVAQHFRGTPAVPDFTTNRSTERFRTAVTNGARYGPNFAGEWTIVLWGCGTSCQAGVMVSARSGQIVDLPSALSRGAAYHLDSRLLVIDPIGQNVQPFESPYARFYEWTGSTFALRDSTRAPTPQR